MSYWTVLRGYFCAQGVFRLFFRKLSFQAFIFLPFRFFPQSIFPLIHNPFFLLSTIHYFHLYTFVYGICFRLWMTPILIPSQNTLNLPTNDNFLSHGKKKFLFTLLSPFTDAYNTYQWKKRRLSLPCIYLVTKFSNPVQTRICLVLNNMTMPY